MMIDPRTRVYPGMIAGEHTRDLLEADPRGAARLILAVDNRAWRASSLALKNDYFGVSVNHA